jgi:glycosyltransferase involved in cell wall biosynthesis
MKINVYCYDDIDNPRCGGGGAYRELAVHRIIAERHHVRFFTGNFNAAKSYNAPNFTYRHLGIKANYLLSRISFAVMATIHSFFSKADIIAIPFSIYSPVFTFLFKPRKTVVLFFHITGKEVFKKYGPFGLFPLIAEKTVFRFGRNYITLTDSMAREIAKRRPSVRAKAGYISFDTSILSQSVTDDKFILCFGRIDIHMKGIDVLIPAFEKISSDFPDYRLVIAGRVKESDAERLQQRITKSHYRNKIQCIINASDREKKRLFHSATFVCMPSRYEGWNIAAIEAAASSKPTLGTRIHGLTDAIKENETGLLVQPENIDELAEKMKLLLSDSSLREKLGKNGYVWAQQFTIERVAKIQEDFYREVAGDPEK